MINNTRKGFTLIEILIVVAIIAILASVVLVGLGPTQQAGRDSRRLADLHETQNALELYYNKCGYYPGNAQPAACGNYTGGAANWAAMSAAITGSGLGIAAIPNDPQLSAGGTYYYSVSALGASYVIAARMEQGASASVFRNYVSPTIVGYAGTVPACGVGAGAAPSYYCTSL